MQKQELELLKAIVNHPSGQLSEAEFINGLAKHNRRLVENLVVKQYVEEVPRTLVALNGGSYSVNFYRATAKGIVEFASWYEKMWFYMKGDIRTAIFSIITALITTLIINFIKD